MGDGGERNFFVAWQQPSSRSSEREVGKHHHLRNADSPTIDQHEKQAEAESVGERRRDEGPAFSPRSVSACAAYDDGRQPAVITPATPTYSTSPSAILHSYAYPPSPMLYAYTSTPCTCLGRARVLVACR